MEGIERLKSLILGQNDKALNKVVEYLITRIDMNEKYLSLEKDLKGMISFIRSEAQKQAENGIAMIEDEVVYGWAIHYFDESNEKLGVEKQIVTDQIEQKIVKPTTEKTKCNNTKKVESTIEQLSLF